MILGLNTNHEYNGKVYHVQTEDSGVDNPVIITHCFIGGTIIKSRKTDYTDALGREDLETHLTEIARAQHRGMVQSLLGGEFTKEILSVSRGGGGIGRSDIPMANKGRSFKPGSSKGAPNKLPGNGPVSKGPMKAVVAPKAPPPAAGRATAAFSDTQVMDIDAADLVEVEVGDAELSASGPLQFPSRLLDAGPLDPVVLAYLLEDEPTR